MSKKKSNDIMLNKGQVERILDEICEIESDNIEVKEVYLTNEDGKLKVSIPYSFTSFDVREIIL